MGNHIRTLLGTACLATVIGCGGGSGDGGGGGTGGGGTGGASVGFLLDSAVSGAEYGFRGVKQITGADGRFEYDVGTPTEFSIGGIRLGTAQGKPRLTLLDLVPGAVNETDTTVTNIARLLQTLDSDGNADNGIDIPEAVRLAAAGLTLDFTASESGFEGSPALVALLSSINLGSLIPAQQAQRHLASTLFSILAGKYTGTFGGDASGNFVFFVDIEGLILGAGLAAGETEPFTIFGTVQTSGESTIGSGSGAVSVGATFDGIIANGSINGTWDDTAFGDSGTFSGSQSDSVGTVDPSIIAQVAGSYAGTFMTNIETGAFTDFVVDPDGRIRDGAGGIVGAVLSTDANGANFLAVDGEGLEISGRFETSGAMTANLRGLFSTETGTVSGTRQSTSSN